MRFATPRFPLASRFPIAAACWLFLIVAPGASVQATQVDLDALIDLSLVDAEVTDVLQSFASIAGVELRADPEVRGTVTVALDDVPIQQALRQTCRIRSLHCELLPGFGAEPGQLWVRPADTNTNANTDGGPPLAAGLFETISLSLAGADLVDVLEAMAEISGRPLQIDPGLQGRVTLELRNAPWPFVLAEICDLAACRVEWGPTLRVTPSISPSTRRRSLELENAALGEVLESLAADPIFGTIGPLVLDAQANLDIAVSARVHQAPWPDLLQALCAPVGLVCGVRYGAPGSLEVRALGQTASPPASQASIEPSAANISNLDLGLRWLHGQQVFAERTIHLDWQHPSAEIVADNGQRLRLVWVPLGPDSQSLFPVSYGCDGELELFPLVALPLADSLTVSVGSQHLDLEPTTNPERSKAPRPSAPCPGASRPALEVTLPAGTLAGHGLQPGPTLTLEAQVGTLLLLVAADGKTPNAALLSLGDDRQGHRRLALIRPDRRDAVAAAGSTENRSGAHGLLVQRSRIEPGASREIHLETPQGGALGLFLPAS